MKKIKFKNILCVNRMTFWKITFSLLYSFFVLNSGMAQFGPLPETKNNPTSPLTTSPAPSPVPYAEIPKLESEISTIQNEQQQTDILLTSATLSLITWQSQLQQYQALADFNQSQFGNNPQSLFIKEELDRLMGDLESRLEVLNKQIEKITSRNEEQNQKKTKLQADIEKYKNQLRLEKQRADIQSYNYIEQYFLGNASQHHTSACFPPYLNLSQEVQQSLSASALQSNISNLALVPQACYIPEIIKRLGMLTPGNPYFTGDLAKELTKQNQEQLNQPIADFAQKSSSELFAFYLMGLTGDTHFTKSNVKPKKREFAINAGQLIIKQILTNLSGEEISSLPDELFTTCLEPQLKILYPEYLSTLDGVVTTQHKKYGLFGPNIIKEKEVSSEKEKEQFFQAKLGITHTSDQRYWSIRALQDLCKLDDPETDPEKLIIPYLTPEVLMQTVLMSQAQDNEGTDTMALGCQLLSQGNLPRDPHKIFPLSSKLKADTYLAIGNTTNFSPGGLSAEELAAIKSYTGSGYVQMNRYLWCRDKAPPCSYSPTDQQSVDLVQSGLMDLPPFIGETYRGMGGGTPITVIGPWLTEGNIVANSGFWSSSTAPGVAKSFGGNSGYFLVLSASAGRDISGFSVFPGEKEVLIPHHTCFYIDRVTKNTNNTEIYAHQVACTGSEIVYGPAGTK